MVGYDSIIPPGREGSIRPRVELRNARGKITKQVTVASNAANLPTLKLTLAVDVKQIISMSSSFVQVKSGDPKGAEIVLSTEKPDLLVSKVYLKNSGDHNAPNWQVELPTYFDFELAKPSAPKPDGYRDYTLKLKIDLGDKGESKYGDIVLETNHPDKKELSIRGRIEAK